MCRVPYAIFSPSISFPHFSILLPAAKESASFILVIIRVPEVIFVVELGVISLFLLVLAAVAAEVGLRSRSEVPHCLPRSQARKVEADVRLRPPRQTGVNNRRE